MTKDNLNEREFELVNIIGAKLSANQRDLSRHLDLSLGSTNMLIRRLVNKGYIRISQLNKRKVRYLLTSKGFAEKMNKSVKYTQKTIQSITFIKEGIQRILSRLYEQGERQFVIAGRSDFALLVELVFRNPVFADCQVCYLDEATGEVEGLLLICTEKFETQDDHRVMDMLRELSKDNYFIKQDETQGEADNA